MCARLYLSLIQFNLQQGSLLGGRYEECRGVGSQATGDGEQAGDSQVSGRYTGEG